MNSSGTTFRTLDLGVELGGEGFAEYSVKDKELTLSDGVLGRELLPLELTPFSMFAVGQLLSLQLRKKVESYVLFVVVGFLLTQGENILKL